jgi:hypothetical protein
MNLTFSRNGESGEWLGFFVQLHLPESRGEVQGVENIGVGSSDVADAFGDLLHGVFVNIRVLVQLSEVLYNLESLPLLFGYAEYW